MSSMVWVGQSLYSTLLQVINPMSVGNICKRPSYVTICKWCKKKKRERNNQCLSLPKHARVQRLYFLSGGLVNTCHVPFTLLPVPTYSILSFNNAKHFSLENKSYTVEPLPVQSSWKDWYNTKWPNCLFYLSNCWQVLIKKIRQALFLRPG